MKHALKTIEKSPNPIWCLRGSYASETTTSVQIREKIDQNETQPASSMLTKARCRHPDRQVLRITKPPHASQKYLVTR